MKIQRTWFAADKTGFHMLHALFQTSLKYDAVERYDEYFVSKLLVDEGRCQGVVAIELATGKVLAITAKAVILSTGGCGKIFPFTTNANIKNGDGMALAYRAGAPVKDMEFVQYHPTGLPLTGILITEASRSEGGWLLNKERLPVPPRLRPWHAGAEAGPALDGAGPARSAVPGFRQGAGEGTDPRGALRPLRPSRHPPPGSRADRQEAALRTGALHQVLQHRSRRGDDSGAAGGPLHDGGRLHGPQRGDSPAGPLRSRRGGLRQHQRSQSAGVELADGAARLRGAGGSGSRRLRR